MKTPISFRLRKDVDADLIAAIAAMDHKRVAEMARNGLRLMLGIKTTKHVQIVEQPLVAAEQPLVTSDVEVSVKSTGASKSFGKPLVTSGNVQSRQSHV